MIVCLGDSITYGQHLKAGERPWPLLIHGHEIKAAGVPSDTTRLGLERFPADVQSVDAKAVIVQFGHNDANRWETDRGLPRVSAKAYAANLEEMVHRIRTFDAVPFLCTITPSRRSLQHAKDVALYDSILRDVAKYQSVTLIDVRSAFEGWETPDDWDEPVDLLLDDGLHLSAAGHRLYAATVQRALDSVWYRA